MTAPRLLLLALVWALLPARVGRAQLFHHRPEEVVVELPPGFTHRDLWIIVDEDAAEPWALVDGHYVARSGCGGVLRAPYVPFFIETRTARGELLGPSVSGSLRVDDLDVHFDVFGGSHVPDMSEAILAQREAEEVGAARCSEGSEPPLAPPVRHRPSRDGALEAWLAFLLLASLGLAALQVPTPARGLLGLLSRRYAPIWLLGATVAAGAIYAQLPDAVGWVFGLACWGIGVLPSTLLGLAAASNGIALWLRQLPPRAAATTEEREDDGYREAGGSDDPVEASPDEAGPDFRLPARIGLQLVVALVCFSVTLLLAVGMSFADFDGAWR